MLLKKIVSYLKISYDAKENMDVVKKVIEAVEKDNGGQEKCPWSHAQLKG